MGVVRHARLGRVLGCKGCIHALGPVERVDGTTCSPCRGDRCVSTRHNHSHGCDHQHGANSSPPWIVAHRPMHMCMCLQAAQTLLFCSRNRMPKTVVFCLYMHTHHGPARVVGVCGGGCHHQPGVLLPSVPTRAWAMACVHVEHSDVCACKAGYFRCEASPWCKHGTRCGTRCGTRRGTRRGARRRTWRDRGTHHIKQRVDHPQPTRVGHAQSGATTHGPHARM